MLRRLHSLTGLFAALLVMLMAISGAVLSINPALERFNSSVPAAGQISVAQLAGRIAQHYPDAEQIQRTPSGSVIVYFSQDGEAGAEYVDPANGQGIGTYAPSAFSVWVKDLHRSLLLDDSGRAIAGIGALAMLLLSLSGAWMLVRRLGGWRQLLRPLHGNFNQRWHSEAGRFALLGLLLSSVTALYLSAATFGLVSDGMQNEADFPSTVAGGEPALVASLNALQSVDLNDLRELVYPNPQDPNDVFSLSTAAGDGYVDQASGALLSFQPHNSTRDIYELIYQLHTGEGLWWLGLLLGACALCVPLMSISGAIIWWQRRRARPRFAHNTAAQSADTLILVGSENNSTWGFARTLHDELVKAGMHVHSTSMNQLAGEYRQAKRLIVLTSTYGDGDAPASAKRFLERLAGSPLGQDIRYAVLGFGDRQFPQFCQFARQVDSALLQQGLKHLLPLEGIDRQSGQEFARWGKVLGAELGLELNLLHSPERPATRQLQLVERVCYGGPQDTPTQVLRFQSAAPATHAQRLLRLFGANGLPRFEAGDLIGILPPGSPLPRLYSLASSSRNGILEICVRKHAHGLCSSYLHELSIGASIQGFIQCNPEFRPHTGKNPVILIGAGTGIGPLAGFIRNNRYHQPMHLYWGGRNPQTDFLYEPELSGYLADKRLTGLQTVFSRVSNGGYVQERILSDALQMRRLVEKGAQVLVCGSRDMANSVMQALDSVLAPMNLSVVTLKSQGRYREDVY
jgi:sulfite reductase (NADPH) flavoprotein alpha-component